MLCNSNLFTFYLFCLKLVVDYHYIPDVYYRYQHRIILYVYICYIFQFSNNKNNLAIFFIQFLECITL